MFFLVLSLLLEIGLAVTFNGKLDFPPNVDKFSFEAALTEASLYFDDKREILKFDNSFSISGIEEGIHHFEIYHPLFLFPTYLVEVESNHISVRSIETTNTGKPVQSFFVNDGETAMMQVAGKYQYYQPRQSISIIRMMMNPMFLMMMFSLGMMFCMPKMMENMDPEDLKRMKEQRESQPDVDPQKMLNSLLGVKGAESDSDSD